MDSNKLSNWYSWFQGIGPNPLFAFGNTAVAADPSNKYWAIKDISIEVWKCTAHLENIVVKWVGH